MAVHAPEQRFPSSARLQPGKNYSNVLLLGLCLNSDVAALG